MRKYKWIGEKQSAGFDEVHANWYECPSCKEAYIIKRFNYCPDCGVGLKWRKIIQISTNQSENGKFEDKRIGGD